MRKLSTLTIIILMVMLGGISYADDRQIDTYKINEPINIAVHLVNSSGAVTGSACKIQIKNESLQTLINDNMYELGAGWYNYTYITSNQGVYYCRENCTQGSLYAAGICDFAVESKMETILINLFYFATIIGILLLLYGMWIRSENILTLSGIVFIFIGLYLYRVGYANIQNQLTEAIAVIIIGIGAFLVLVPNLENLVEAFNKMR